MKKDVKSWVKELRKQGYTFKEIGELIGKTRQRAYQIFIGE